MEGVDVKKKCTPQISDVINTWHHCHVTNKRLKASKNTSEQSALHPLVRVAQLLQLSQHVLRKAMSHTLLVMC
jgi:hypothetical protein